MVELVMPALALRLRPSFLHRTLALIQSRVALHQTDRVVVEEPLAGGAFIIGHALLLPDFNCVQRPHAQEHLDVFQKTLRDGGLVIVGRTGIQQLGCRFRGRVMVGRRLGTTVPDSV